MSKTTVEIDHEKLVAVIAEPEQFVWLLEDVNIEHRGRRQMLPVETEGGEDAEG